MPIPSCDFRPDSVGLPFGLSSGSDKARLNRIGWFSAGWESVVVSVGASTERVRLTTKLNAGDARRP
jgi:hypothetical protein